jgi:hypothetical protein
MKLPRIRWARFGGMAFFLFVLGPGELLSAQCSDFQLVVNGPWAYVADPHPEKDPNPNGYKTKRLVLVTSQGMGHSHKAFIHDGVDGRLGTGPVDPGLYYLDLDNRSFAGQAPVNDLPAMTYFAPQPVDAGKIDYVIYSEPNRVAFSVPQPDYVSTYIGQYGVGLAESKIDINHITPDTPYAYHTIELVLHYQVCQPVSSVTCSTCSKSLLRGNDIPVSGKGLSIASGAYGKKSSRRCDDYSSQSFSESKALWGLVHYARFPEELDEVGTQHHGYYNYDCPESFSSSKQENFDYALRCSDALRSKIAKLKASVEAELQDRSAAAQGPREGPIACEPQQHKAEDACWPERKAPNVTFCDVQDGISAILFGTKVESVQTDLACLAELLRNPRTAACRGRIEEISTRLTGLLTAMGSTDCHAAQMSINGAIP